jgi:hypothetical protein
VVVVLRMNGIYFDINVERAALQRNFNLTMVGLD